MHQIRQHLPKYSLYITGILNKSKAIHWDNQKYLNLACCLLFFMQTSKFKREHSKPETKTRSSQCEDSWYIQVTQ